MKKTDRNRIDWMVTLVPFILIMGLAMLLFLFSEQANAVISQVRFFLWRYYWNLLFNNGGGGSYNILISGFFKVWRYCIGKAR